jgi:hypothetical protein
LGIRQRSAAMGGMSPPSPSGSDAVRLSNKIGYTEIKNAFYLFAY